MERKHVHRTIALVGLLAAGCPSRLDKGGAKYVFTIVFDPTTHCMTGAKDSTGAEGPCDPADGTPAQCLKARRGERLRFTAAPTAGNEFVVRFQGQSPFAGGLDVPSKGGFYEAPTRTDVARGTRFRFTVDPPPGSTCPKVNDPQIILN